MPNPRGILSIFGMRTWGGCLARLRAQLGLSFADPETGAHQRYQMKFLWTTLNITNSFFKVPLG